MLDCVTHCSQSTAHLCEQFLQVKPSNRFGLSHWDPYAVRRGGCLELSYCNMVEWFWWDSSLILTTNWFPAVLWHCWFGHLACKNRPRMTYNVSSGTLNPTHTSKWQLIGLMTTWFWASCNLTQHLSFSSSAANAMSGRPVTCSIWLWVTWSYHLLVWPCCITEVERTPL